MRFGSPEWIQWLLLVIPLAGLFIWMHRRRGARLARMIAPALWPSVAPLRSGRRGAARTGLRLLALFFILLALTRPQWGFRMEEVRQRGLDILVVLDTSRSMLAGDVKPGRLQQAKWAVHDFARRLSGDRIGLVAFAGGSFLQCPLTSDYAAFALMLDDLYAGIIPRGGTAIEQALETALESFDPQTEADRVIILITDGEDHEGDPLRMAQALRKQNIRLFCIGAGTPEGDLIPATQGYVKDRQGRVVKSALNEALLERLARETGGFYVRSAQGDFGLDRVYRLGIAGLRRGEQESRFARVYEERFGWFAAAALLCLLAEGAMIPSVRRMAAAAALLLVPVPRADAAGWEPSYRAGDYSNAFEALERTVERFPDIGSYNRGSALYRLGDFEGAETLFGEAASKTKDDRLRQKALYNRGTALLAEIKKPEARMQPAAAADKAGQAAGLFEQALMLDPDDTDAKKNLERALILKKQFEEQIQQQQEQQQQQEPQQQQEQPDQPQPQAEQQESPQPEQPGESQPQPQNGESKEEDPSGGQPQEPSDAPSPSGEPSMPLRDAGEMNEEEARQLLDAMKRNEQDQRARLRSVLGRPVPVEKDW